MLTKVHEEKGATAVFVTVVRKTRYVEKNVVGAARPKYRSKLKSSTVPADILSRAVALGTSPSERFKKKKRKAIQQSVHVHKTSKSKCLTGTTFASVLSPNILFNAMA